MNNSDSKIIDLKNTISEFRNNDNLEFTYYDSSKKPTFLKGRLNLLYEYITQRYLIYRRRESGEDKSIWYNDCNELFKEYKFTNIFREDDRVSRYLISNISRNDEFNLSEKFWRSFLFRLYNRIDTCDELGLLDKDLWEFSDSEMNNRSESINHDAYTRAFKTIGLKLQLGKFSPDHKILGPYYFVKDLRHQWLNSNCNFNEHPLKSQTSFRSNLTAEDLFNWFIQFKGIGNFFAYQLFVDATYIKDCPVSENAFVVAGPGCVRGLNNLFESWGSLNSHSELLFYLKDNLENIFKDEVNKDFSAEELFKDRPKYSRDFNVMSLENVFCEFSKFLYVRLNIGNGKTKKYHPYQS